MATKSHHDGVNSLELSFGGYLTESEALRLTVKIREKVTEIWPLIVRAFEGRAWVALGLPSWDEYCSSHLRGMTPAIDRAERQQRVIEMRDAGMSTRAIGSVLGVSHPTVMSDLSVGGKDLPPEAERSPVVGLDGKEYAPTRPSPPDPQPFRAPEPEDLPDWVEPEAAERYAEAAARQQNASYMHEFMKAFGRSDDFLQFDVERVADLASRDIARAISDYARSVQKFNDRFTQRRSGLRLVSGETT